ncbi:glycosyltransferase family 2 protein [Flavobacterium ginsengiterrae]|uniref:Galactosyltransferase-like protein n=1 Tax=Flavobacterium ginsengiterrae TaxID=871695 RepID=A0ABP7H0T6_9FLAO
MITIIFPYRDREPWRVKKSLDSLVTQSNKDFKVLFVDYGSSIQTYTIIQKLISEYSFVSYFYNFSQLQPWSRAKAINIGLKNVTSEYVFTADIDMIFRTDFIEKLNEIKSPSKIYYFKVGFLTKSETQKDIKFEDYIINSSSKEGAQGLSLFALKEVEAINGYDEFLHFWGSEDIDIHNRLERNQLKSIFYNKEILLLHQWHKSYRKEERKKLTTDLQLSNVVKLNQQHLIQNDRNAIKKTNHKSWGKSISFAEFEELKNYNVETVLINKQEIITHFLFCELPNVIDQIIVVKIIEDSFQDSLKYKVKKLVGKKVPKYYSLKEVNDMFLLHIITFYHTEPYCYSVSQDLKSITFRIKK